MGIQKVGVNIGKGIIAWTRTSGKSLLTTKPIIVNATNLKYVPNSLELPKELEIWKVLNKIKLKPQISKILSSDFTNKKCQLLKSFTPKEYPLLHKRIALTQNPDGLADILESHQTNLLLQGGMLKKRIIEASGNSENLRNIYMKYYYEFTECAIKIQKALASKSTTTKAIQIENQLKDYGIGFVAINNDLQKGKKLLEACKIWQKTGNKMPDGIIISDTIPMSLASGQCLRDSNRATIILLRPSSNRLINFGDFIDRLQVKFINWFKPNNSNRNKSTDSKFHTIIHEFSHSVQPQPLIEQQIKLPNQYITIAKSISKYANGSFEELYAELKTMSILTPDKMSKSLWDLLEYLEKQTVVI